MSMSSSSFQIMSTLILLLSILESASAWGTRAAKKGRPAKSRMNGVLIIVKATALVGGVFVFYYAFFKVVARINRTPFGEWIKKVSWSLVGERMVEWLKSNRRREEERVGRKIDWDKMD